MGTLQDKLLTIFCIWIATAILLFILPTYGAQIVLIFSAFLIGELMFMFLRTGNGNFVNPFGRMFLTAEHSYVMFYIVVLVSSVLGGYAASFIVQTLAPTFANIEVDLIIGFVLAVLTFFDLRIRYLVKR